MNRLGHCSGFWFLKVSLVSLGLLILTLVPLSGCRRQEPFRETRFLMGTLVEAVVYPDTEGAREGVSRIFSQMEALETVADARRGGSPFESLSSGESVRLPSALQEILAAALEVAQASSGAFDPTMGGVVDLWGFNTDRPHLPDEEELEEALAGVGYKRLSLENALAVPQVKGLLLDLGGIAKGFAVDEAVKALERDGLRAGIVNAGGDLRVFGNRPGRGTWRIGIQDPDDHQGLLGVLEVSSGAVATSGDYERYFERDGERFHHILDPRTGYPARQVRSATVLAPDCALADALATAVFVMGPEKGLALLEEMDGVEGILVSRTGDLVKTKGIGSVVRFERR